MSELIDYAQADGVATLTLRNGPMNVISLTVLDALNRALERAIEDRAVVVITGQPGVFSAGYDLKVLRTSAEAAADLVTAGSRFSHRLLAHPYPVVVACSGHAMGEGAFILLSADSRIGADGPFKISLPEVAVGMTMHRVGLELARDRLSRPAFQRAVNNAEVFDPRAAVDAGFLDRVVPAETLMDAAVATANELKALDMVAHRHTKLLARKALLEALDDGIKTDRSEILLQTEFR